MGNAPRASALTDVSGCELETPRRIDNRLNEATRRRGRRDLVIAIAAIVVIWGLLLPALARHPTIAAHIDHLDAKHVDASALYYTDLDPRVFEPDPRRDQPTR